MVQLYTWIKDIFLIIITLSFFQILLPDSNMSKYLKFIFSLVVLVIVIEPIIFFVKKM